MKICIEKDDQGRFLVYAENEQQGETTESIPGETMAQESSEEINKQQARDLSDALVIAGRLLNGSPDSDGAGSMFDQGMQKVLPQRRGM